MAVPSKGSGLEDTDVYGLLDLLQRMTEDPRLPLTLASTPVWDDLGRLRDEVVDIWERSSNKDKVNMQALLAWMDAVYVHRPSSTQEHRPSDHAQAQASGTSAVVEPNLPCRGSTLGSNYASTLAIIEERNVSSPTQEADFRGTVFPVDSLFDKSSLTHISISQASLRHHPIISATSLPIFITPRTPSSPARLDPMAWSLDHSPHPSYPLCTLTWETQT